MRHVEDERRPPLVTITDPQHPGPLTDVLQVGDGQEPWRPGRRVLGVAVVLLVAAALAVFLVHRSADRAADRRSLDAIRLSAVDSDERIVVLINEGPDPVTVEDLTIGREGAVAQRVSVLLLPDERRRVLLNRDSPCPTSVPTAAPSALRLTVRSDRGDTRVVRVDIHDTALSVSLELQLREQCGLYPPADSLDLQDPAVTLVRDAIVVRTRLYNRASEPRVVTAILAGPGLRASVSPPLPITASAALPGQVGTPVGLTIRVVVRDCAAVRAAAAVATQDTSSEVYAQLAGPGRPVGRLFLGDAYARAVGALVDQVC